MVTEASVALKIIQARRKLLRARIVKTILALHLQIMFPRHRKRNIHRNWRKVIDFIDNKSDRWFYKSYRLTRKIFHEVLQKILPQIEAINKEMATRSSGDYVPGKVLFAATLRFLAGASYIDLVDLYLLPECCPHMYIWKTISALHSIIDNITLPSNSDEWYHLSYEWKNKMTKKFKTSEPYLKGTTLAIDGIVIATIQPRPEEVNGDIVGNRNRKGCFAMIAACAVDAFARFKYAELKWSGSTPDSVALRSSELGNLLQNGELPDGLHIVADEAYCYNHHQVLTPLSKKMLSNIRSQPEEYQKRRGFNYLLSFQRSTVERAFGMLVRKFIVLNHTFECKREHTSRIFKVCCYLHNLCVNEWIIRHGPSKDYECNVGENQGITDDFIREEFLNDPTNSYYDPLPHQPKSNEKNTQGPRRDRKINEAFHLGFRFHY